MSPRAVLFAVTASMLLLSGCADTQAVADLGQEAAETVAQGPPIFRDLADSCDARHRINQNVRAEWEKPATPEAEPEPCARFRTQAETMRADSLALRTYFQSLRALALARGRASADAGKSARSKGGAAPGAAGKDLAVASDLNNLAGQLAAEHYQRSRVIKVLRQADPDISAITNSLLEIVTGLYLPALKQERGDLDLAYVGFGKTDARNNPSLLFLLNRAYRDDIASIDRRQHAAEAYSAGVEKVRDAHHRLTEDADSHDFKKLYAEAEDYAGQLQQLVEDVQAAAH